MSKLTKNVISFAFIAIVATFAMGVSAQMTIPTGTGLASADLQDTTMQLIKTILGLLGIVALIMILMGGFKWMTSGGNDEKVGEAKKLLGAGIVGMVIILAAYAIASFVVTNMNSAMTAAE